MESVSSVKSKSRKLSSKKSVTTKKITEKNRLREKIKNCLKHAKKYHIDLNHYGKMKRRCEKMKGGYYSKSQLRSFSKSNRHKKFGSKSSRKLYKK